MANSLTTKRPRIATKQNASGKIRGRPPKKRSEEAGPLKATPAKKAVGRSPKKRSEEGGPLEVTPAKKAVGRPRNLIDGQGANPNARSGTIDIIRVIRFDSLASGKIKFAAAGQNTKRLISSPSDYRRWSIEIKDDQDPRLRNAIGEASEFRVGEVPEKDEKAMKKRIERKRKEMAGVEERYELKEKIMKKHEDMIKFFSESDDEKT